jgi:hypothetical protein
VSTDTVVDEHRRKVTTHWWITRPVNLDRYDVYLARYTEELGFATLSEYMDNDGRWQVQDEGEVIPAVLSLPGYLLHTIKDIHILDGDGLAEALDEFSHRILRDVVAMVGRAEE